MSVLSSAYQLIQGARHAHGAMDPSHSTGERVGDGIRTAGNALSLGGGLATGASMLTGFTGGAGWGGLGSLSLGSVGSIIGGGGAAGAGTAAMAAGGLIAAGAGGVAAGHWGDGAIGRHLGGTQTVNDRGVGGGSHQEADTRPISSRIADSTHTAAGDHAALSIAPYLPTWLGGG